MRFIRQDVLSEAEARELGPYDVAFHGRKDLDERSSHSYSLCAAVSQRQYEVKYDPEAFTLTIGDVAYHVNSLEDVPRSLRARSIVLDATTLEFPEILYLLFAYSTLPDSNRPVCGFFYVEPASYSQRDEAASAVPGNAFALSSGFRAKTALPLFNSMLSERNKAHLVAFLGFEGDRVRRVLDEDDGYLYKNVTIVFGVPPFQPTWDLHSLLANSRLLDADNTDVAYCGANNPRSAYKLVKSAHEAGQSSPNDRLAVAPFGTKPMAIGVALYCLEHDTMRPIFDFPTRKTGRTKGIHRRHWYEIDLRR